TPVNGSISMARMVCNTANVPRAISECVACRMYHATAAEFMPLPNMEITLAVNTQRRARFCRMARILKCKRSEDRRQFAGLTLYGRVASECEHGWPARISKRQA